MARSKKPRKQYKPKGVIRDPLSYVLRGVRPADPEAQLKCRINLHAAMANLTQGRGVKDDWQVVADGVNVGLILCEMGYGEEFVPDLVAAQAAMVMLRDRFRATGRMVFKANEMQAVNVALDLHDQQIGLAPVADFERAIRAVERELARGNYVKVEKIGEPQPPSLPPTPAA